MTIRNGMTDLVDRLRSMTAAGTAEAVVGTIVYWSDTQLQARLDRNRQDYTMHLLAMQPEYLGGTAHYYRYGIPSANVERAESGTAIWRVVDSLGNTRDTALYTADYDGQVITFAADQGGTAYYLSYRQYNLNRAAAEIWRDKAAQVANGYDIETDNHNLKRSQRFKQYMDTAKQYDRLAISEGAGNTGGMVRISRADAY